MVPTPLRPVCALALALALTACTAHRSPSPRTASPSQTAHQSQPNTAAPAQPADSVPRPVPQPPQGFGTLDWGSPSTAKVGLALHDKDPATGVSVFIWPQGPRDVAGTPVRDAFYEFFQDQFYHVWIDFDGMAAYRTILADLTRTYGPPTTENQEKYYHAWTVGPVNIYCAFHPAENEGDVSFFYQPIYDRMAAAKKARPGKSAQRSAKQ